MNKRRILFFVVSLVYVFTVQAQNGKDVYLDMNAPRHERILDLLSKLTIEEKISLLRATSPGIPRLHIEISTVISDEARARWNELEQGKKQLGQFSDLLTFWSPTVNMARDPRWGRTPETYGEDTIFR